MLRGLLSSSNYNSTFGIVKSYDNVASRYVVALEAEKEKEVRVRPHCVRQVEAGEGPCCLRHKVLMQEEVRESLGVDLESGAVQWFGGERPRIVIKHRCKSTDCKKELHGTFQRTEVRECLEYGEFDVGKYLTLAVRKLLDEHRDCCPCRTYDELMAAPSEQPLATQVPVCLRAFPLPVSLSAHASKSLNALVNCACLQMQDKKDRDHVISNENDKAKILRLEKELNALRNQKEMWDAKSVRKLTEDPPVSEREQVTVTMFGSDVKVKNKKFVKFKKTAQYDHKKQWLHHALTGVLAAVRFNAEGSADRAAYILNKAIKELFKGDLEHYIQDVIGGFEIKITPEKLIVANVSKICDDLKTVKTAAARRERDVLLTATVGAAAAKKTMGGTMYARQLNAQLRGPLLSIDFGAF
jgi:hypothetical protein